MAPLKELICLLVFLPHPNEHRLGKSGLLPDDGGARMSSVRSVRRMLHPPNKWGRTYTARALRLHGP